MLSSFRFIAGTALLCGCLSVAAGAQGYEWHRSNSDRAFALVYDAQPVSFNGADTPARDRLHRYVDAHPGRYLVFEDNGLLRRVDNAASVEEVERLLAPLRPLQVQEDALGDQQKPLQQQMKELSARMRAAQTADERTSLATQMSELAGRMERIGQEQGRIGNQMGTIGNAFYRRAQAIFVQCLQDDSCHRAG